MLSSTEKRFHKILFLLAVLGIVSSLWLLQLYINLLAGAGSLESACYTILNQGKGCESLAISSYSHLGPIPLAALALAYYLVQIVLLLWSFLFPEHRKGLLQTSFLLASLAIPITFTMIFISSFLLNELCLMCSLLWIINLIYWPMIAAILSYYSFPFTFKMRLKSFFPGLDMDPFQIKIVKKSCLIAAAICLLTLILNALYMNKHIDGNSAAIQRGVLRYKRAPKVFLPKEAYQNHTKGTVKEKASIAILKFSDFQCPACRKAALNFKPFYLKFKDKIHFSYRHYPLDPSCNPSRPNGFFLSCKIAIAVECAGKQGKFYPMHDKVFDKQKEISLSKLKEIALSLNLDIKKYETCLTDPEIERKIQEDINFGNSADITATPTFIVNGRRISGAFSSKQWEALLKDIMLNK